MPGMLVHVDPERLAALRGDPAAPWTIRRGELLAPALLGPADWTLYVATVREDRARVVAYLENVAGDDDELGAATPCDVDITPLLERLGCHGGAHGFRTWAMRPRVLTKTDSDLLRYHLGLPLDVIAPPLPPPSPAPRPALDLAGDAIALQLLAAVHEDLASDANRMVLADRLLELGDPRGEMIALQLARARSGAPATPRERELIAQHGHAWVKPLAQHLVLYGFRRGFLATAAVDDRAMMPPDLYEHPIWSTVEELETRNPTLLLAPGLRSLRRVAISGEVLETLAFHDRPLAIEVIVGGAVQAGRRLVQGGVALPPHDLQPLARTTVLDRLHSMCISIETEPLADQAEIFLGTPFGMHLQHVELFHGDAAAIEPERWRRLYERNRPQSLGLRVALGGWIVVVLRQRQSLTVQLGEPVYARSPDIRPLVPAITSLGRGLRSIAVERVGEDPFGIGLRPVVDELQRVLPTVERPPAHVWRSP